MNIKTHNICSPPWPLQPLILPEERWTQYFSRPPELRFASAPTKLNPLSVKASENLFLNVSVLEMISTEKASASTTKIIPGLLTCFDKSFLLRQIVRGGIGVVAQMMTRSIVGVVRKQIEIIFDGIEIAHH